MKTMKRLVDTLGAVLTAICLCIFSARADSLSGGVLIVAVAAIACSLLIRAIQKRRNNKK